MKTVHLKINIIFCFILFINESIKAQGALSGINTQEPKANLHIDPKDDQNPESGAGILIPNLKAFPGTNPVATQNGILIYRSEVQGSGLDGFYYWDAPNNSWEYIVSQNIQEIDLNKYAASGTSFETNITQGNINYVKVPFEVIESPKASYTLNANDDFVVGQTGKFYISVTGGVNRSNSGANTAEGISTAVFINGGINNDLTSSTVFPSVLNNNRSVTFAISSVVLLQAGDVISLRTKRQSASETATLTVDSIFTMVLSYLD